MSTASNVLLFTSPVSGRNVRLTSSTPVVSAGGDVAVVTRGTTPIRPPLVITGVGLEVVALVSTNAQGTARHAGQGLALLAATTTASGRRAELAELKRRQKDEDELLLLLVS